MRIIREKNIVCKGGKSNSQDSYKSPDTLPFPVFQTDF